MKVIKLVSLLLCSLFILTGCGGNSGNLALKINDVKITKSKFNKAFLKSKRTTSKMLAKNGDKLNMSNIGYRKKMAHGMIQATLIQQELKKRNITATKEEIKKERERLVKQSGSEERYLETLKLNNVDKEQEQENLAYFVKLNKLINAITKPKVTDSEIRKFYNDHKGEFYIPEKIRFSQIFLKTNYAAVKKELIEQDKKMKLSTEEIDKLSRETVNKNEELLKVLESKVTISNFAEVAKAYSQDNSAKNGGDMGFVTRDEISHLLYDALSPRKVGEIGPTIETAKGTHIVLVKDKAAQTYLPFENVKADLEVRILNEKKHEYYQKMIDSLIANADIVYYDKTLKADYISPIEESFNKFKKRK